MTVTLTSEALGKQPGATYTGPEEDWLLSEGYAKKANYTGPGVSNTGPTDVVPAKDPSLPENREEPPKRSNDSREEDPGRTDPAMTPGQPAEPIKPPYDFDTGGVNDDAPSDFTVDPTSLPLAGRAVTIAGENLKGVTGITVGGTAATAVTVVSDEKVTATFPAKTAGSYPVVVTNATGSKTKANAVTYAA